MDTALLNLEWLRPAAWWLWPVLPWLWWWRRHRIATSWQRVIDAELLAALGLAPSAGRRNWPWRILLCWTLAVMALAGPSWREQSVALQVREPALVIALDLSLSMLASDVLPNRLERARLKLRDVLRREREGLVGLLVFAGDAYPVTPLTRDVATIEHQLQVLEPNLMPLPGSRPHLALQQAQQLLAGHEQGHVLLIGDDAGGDEALQQARQLHAAGIGVSALAVGTEAGAPLSDGRGGYHLDQAGNIVLPQLDFSAFERLASVGGGIAVALRSDSADLDRLQAQFALNSGSARDSGQQQRLPIDDGPWLLLGVLALLLPHFRRMHAP